MCRGCQLGIGANNYLDGYLAHFEGSARQLAQAIKNLKAIKREARLEDKAHVNATLKRLQAVARELSDIRDGFGK